MKLSIGARGTPGRFLAATLAACAAAIALFAPPAACAPVTRGLRIGAATAADTVSVTVSGAVATPGQRPLPRGARLNDALKAASPSLDADLRNIAPRGVRLVMQNFRQAYAEAGSAPRMAPAPSVDGDIQLQLAQAARRACDESFHDPAA